MTLFLWEIPSMSSCWFWAQVHDAIGALRYRDSEIVPCLNWILFPQEQPRFAVGERKSQHLPPPSHLPAGISNLAVRNKEATIFRADLALNRGTQGALRVLFPDGARRHRSPAWERLRGCCRIAWNFYKNFYEENRHLIIRTTWRPGGNF